ncbi:MAG: DUF6436 domain-containing protein [Thiohalophilus sp.]
MAVTLFVAWIGFTAYAFWWFEFKNLRPFDTTSQGTVATPDMQYLYRSLMASLPDTERDISVVHFWNPDCYCNRFNLLHLKQIMDEYKTKNVHFYVAVSRSVVSDKLRDELAAGFGDIKLLALGDTKLKAMISSTPSAAVLRPGEGITYFGPYSEGAMCSRQNGSFVETVLDASLGGNVSAQLNSLAFGCYCDW